MELELHPIACLRCRNLKVSDSVGAAEQMSKTCLLAPQMKCSRQRPSCARCFRLHHDCQYSEPRSKSLAVKSSVTEQQQFRTTDGLARRIESTRQPFLQPYVEWKMISRTTGLALIDLYLFTVAHSGLLFQRNVLVKLYYDDRLSSFLLQSIFVLALR